MRFRPPALSRINNITLLAHCEVLISCHDRKLCLVVWLVHTPQEAYICESFRHFQSPFLLTNREYNLGIRGGFCYNGIHASNFPQTWTLLVFLSFCYALLCVTRTNNGKFSFSADVDAILKSDLYPAAGVLYSVYNNSYEIQTTITQKATNLYRCRSARHIYSQAFSSLQIIFLYHALWGVMSLSIGSVTYEFTNIAPNF